MGLLLLVLLILSAVVQPEISQTGNGGDYRVVKADFREKIPKEVRQGETLAFFINHHNVEIYDELL